MCRVAVLGLVAALGACAAGGHNNSDGRPQSDAARTDSHHHDDGNDDHHDGMPDGNSAPSHVVLSEICLGPDGSEFVEIVNPTAATDDLSQYYLANHGSYFKLPANQQVMPQSHFIVRFPAG